MDVHTLVTHCPTQPNIRQPVPHTEHLTPVQVIAGLSEWSPGPTLFPLPLPAHPQSPHRPLSPGPCSPSRLASSPKASLDLSRPHSKLNFEKSIPFPVSSGVSGGHGLGAVSPAGREGKLGKGRWVGAAVTGGNGPFPILCLYINTATATITAS